MKAFMRGAVGVFVLVAALFVLHLIGSLWTRDVPAAWWDGMPPSIGNTIFGALTLVLGGLLIGSTILIVTSLAQARWTERIVDRLLGMLPKRRPKTPRLEELSRMKRAEKYRVEKFL